MLRRASVPVYSRGMPSKHLIPILALLLLAAPASADDLGNDTSIQITRTWSQEPGGWTYPMAIRVPDGEAPARGHPVCIVLHGNGGNGQGMVGSFANLLPCHAIVAPSGYASSWNICGEASDAPDLDMVRELIERLQDFENVDAARIRIVGISNGSALANNVLITNTNPGLDAVCAVVSQLSEAQHREDIFRAASGATDPGEDFCGYDEVVTPVTGRRYLSICNENDGLIPYEGGRSPVGLTFLDAREATFIVARLMGHDGDRIEGPGDSLGDNVFAYEYLNGQVVHLRGFAGHGMNQVQRAFIPSFFEDCVEPPACPEDLDEDGTVDGTDLSLLLGHWGDLVEPPGTGFDLDGDGIVAGGDLSRILGFWGVCSG